MERIPDTPHTLVDRLDRLGDLFQLVPTGISEQKRLFQHLGIVEVPHTHCLFPAVDVVAFDDWMFPWSRRDCDFDLRVCFCEAGEVVFEKGAVVVRVSWLGFLSFS